MQATFSRSCPRAHEATNVPIDHFSVRPRIPSASELTSQKPPRRNSSQGNTRPRSPALILPHTSAIYMEGGPPPSQRVRLLHPVPKLHRHPRSKTTASISTGLSLSLCCHFLDYFYIGAVNCSSFDAYIKEKHCSSLRK